MPELELELQMQDKYECKAENAIYNLATIASIVNENDEYYSLSGLRVNIYDENSQGTIVMDNPKPSKLIEVFSYDNLHVTSYGGAPDSSAVFPKLASVIPSLLSTYGKYDVAYTVKKDSVKVYLNGDIDKLNDKSTKLLEQFEPAEKKGFFETVSDYFNLFEGSEPGPATPY